MRWARTVSATTVLTAAVSATVAGGLVWATAAIAVEPFDAVVGRVMAERLDTDAVRLGTGFFIDGRGHLATAAHNVVGCHSIRVRRTDGVITDAALQMLDARYDAAVLLSGSPPPTWLALANGPPVSDTLLLHAGGTVPEQTRHFLSGRQVGTDRAGSLQVLVLKPALAGGASGGPVLDASGVVIGMSVGVADIDVRSTLALPSQRLLDMLRHLQVRPADPRLFGGNQDDRMTSQKLEQLNDAVVQVECR